MDLSAFDDLVAYEAADKAIPSISYALFDADKVLAERHIARAGALAADSVFRIGSISKTFAALLAMQLVEAGKLGLDRPVAELLPGFDPAITLGKLLSHRAGLTREAPAGHYLDPCAPTLSATAGGLASVRLKAAADGSAYFYSNAGFALVGRLVELASGRPYAEQLHAALLAPLGLADTTLALDPARREKLAPAMIWSADADAPAPLFEMGSAPAGNVYATLADAAAYGRALLAGGRGLVQPATLSAMWTPRGTDPGRGYGLGFALDRLDGHRSVGHGGAVYGYSSTMQILPEAGLGVVMFSTLDFTGELVSRVTRRLLREALARRGAGATPSPARRLADAGAETAAALAGFYQADGEGPVVEIRAAGPRLTLIEDGVPCTIRPLGAARLALDGRLFGEETTHPAPILDLAGDTLHWRDRTWRRVADPVAPIAPTDLAPYLGTYDPAFMPTVLSISAGQLICRIEAFSVHRCIPLGGHRFAMHGPLYEREILELGLTDAAGRPAIRVGEMLLSKRGL